MLFELVRDVTGTKPEAAHGNLIRLRSGHVITGKRERRVPHLYFDFLLPCRYSQSKVRVGSRTLSHYSRFYVS
jgi:hypothetical protein